MITCCIKRTGIIAVQLLISNVQYTTIALSLRGDECMCPTYFELMVYLVYLYMQLSCTPVHSGGKLLTVKLACWPV